MGATKSEHATIRDAIASAFPSVLPPMPSQITGHRCPTCDAIAEQLRDARWDALNSATVDRLASAIPLLAPRGFVYFLPAFMTRVLAHPGSPITIPLLDALSADRAAEVSPDHDSLAPLSRELHAHRLTRLTPAQRDVVRQVIVWLTKGHAVRTVRQRAIELLEGWGR